LAILISGILISLAIYFSNSQGTTANTNNQPVAVESNQPVLEVNANEVDTTGDPIMGDQNAPLTMVYWFDFQCPFCKNLKKKPFQV